MQSHVLCTVVVNWNKSNYTIVASYSPTNNSEHRRILLDAIKKLSTVEDEKISVIFDNRYIVHILIGELLYYACLTSIHYSPTEAKKVSIFAQKFLDRVRNVYRELPLIADLTQDLDNYFTTNVSTPLKKICTSQQYQDTSSLPIIHGELAEVRKILLDSVQKLIDRGQKLDELVKKTQSLEIMVHKDFILSSRSTKKKKGIFVAIFLSSIMLLSSLVFGILFYIEAM
ncbi:vesicle-associated membrane protein 7B-like [Chelonus insularis]|uniref:vesicle-associated membrane protein 7B-like n=1 Tax=Chelonus insularis TaxID=460826 RepID=UPI00158D2162|nr:vesicle-associated membrane protein 7B-like [Chelonus insularis]